jgi:tetratricopeptide (TPR) repeat protein
MSNIAEMLRQAMEAHQRGEFESAETGYHTVLATAPDDANANHLLSLLYLRSGRFEAAEQLVHRLLSVFPSHPEVLNSLGIALHGQGKYREAIGAYVRMFQVGSTAHEQNAAAVMRSVAPTDRSKFGQFPVTAFEEPGNVQSVFETIYGRRLWGGGSGAGSHPRTMCLYAGYIQHLMESLSIKTIIDIGCGDWQFSQYLDFTGRQYIGLDVVRSVIVTNTATFGAPNIQFQHADATRLTNLPAYDLLLCKDVLQHLSNANVLSFLGKLHRKSHALITNDYHPSNEDCKDGNTRPLDVSAPPFNLPARPVLAIDGKISFLVAPQS